MANALSVQAHTVSHPPPQTQDKLAVKQETHRQQSAPPAHAVQSTHKVDITV